MGRKSTRTGQRTGSSNKVTRARDDSAAVRRGPFPSLPAVPLSFTKFLRTIHNVDLPSTRLPTADVPERLDQLDMCQIFRMLIATLALESEPQWCTMRKIQ